MATSTTKPSVVRFGNKVSACVSQRMYLNETFADFNLIFIENDVRILIPVHKAILATASEVFATMLREPWAYGNEARIATSSYATFKEFLQFFYLPEVTISVNNIIEMVSLAHMYNIDSCVELCAKQMEELLTSENVCMALDMAILYDLSELNVLCLLKISEETKKVLATEGFFQCSKRALSKILSVDSVNCTEYELFNASLNWAKHKTGRRNNAILREALGDCLYSIRFATLDKNEISRWVTKNKGFFKPCELEDLLLAIGPDKAQAKLFTKTAPRQECQGEWDDKKILKCDLVTGKSHDGRTLMCTNVTTFQINKSLLCGGIELGPAFDSLFILKVKVKSSQHNKILEQMFSSATSQSSFLKFRTPIEIRANVLYEILIETGVINFGTEGYNQQKTFGDNITISIETCSPLIKSLYFNQ